MTPAERQAVNWTLTKRDVARLCGVTPRTVTNWMRQGRLTFLKIGRTVRFNETTLAAELKKFMCRSRFFC